MYIFINENEIMSYSGEILKRYVGNRLVKTIANPADDDLKEFGYLPLVETEIPEYDAETQYIEKSYYVENGNIRDNYTIYDIPTEGEEV